MNPNSIKGKLLVHAACAVPSALVFGFCAVRIFKRWDHVYLTVMVLFGVSLIADLLWTRHEVRRLAASENARAAATQFLWSCTFISMLSFGLGMALSGWNRSDGDFVRTFNVGFWSLMTGIGMYPVYRDAKRLADAAGPSPVLFGQAEQGNK